MTTNATKRAGILTTMVAGAALALGIGTAPSAMASDGCQQGFHLDGGACVMNIPGPGAQWIAGKPGCWLNDLGDTRCFPGVA